MITFGLCMGAAVQAAVQRGRAVLVCNRAEREMRQASREGRPADEPGLVRRPRPCRSAILLGLGLGCRVYGLRFRV